MIADPSASTPLKCQPPVAKKRGRIFRRFGRNVKGVAAIEFAFLALPFFMILFATIETSLVFLGELTLDQAVDQVGRTLRTGEAQQASMTKEAFKQKICDRVSYILDCNKLMVDVATFPSFDKIPRPLTNGVLNTAGFGYRPGGAETITALRVFYRWKVRTDVIRGFLSDSSDGTHLLYSIAAFKTEPF